MKMLIATMVFIMAAAIAFKGASNAQVSIKADQPLVIGTGALEPGPSAVLELDSIDKGFLPPRVAGTDAIGNPVEGLVVYDLSAHCLRYYNGELWSDCLGNFTAASWTCGDDLVDGRDAQTYATVQIGLQCWMAENLNIGTMVDGSADQTDNGIVEKYCYFDYASSCDAYGGLYQWDETVQYETGEKARGICPEGWHVPSDAEWCTLENAVDSEPISCSATGLRGVDAGGKLKEAGTTHWSEPNAGATNSTGFSGLPGGIRHLDGTFDLLGHNAPMWSSTENGSSAWNRILDYNETQTDRDNFDKPYGLGVRCVKD